jgi:enoyl-CoA hydratase/carnithine racemase
VRWLVLDDPKRRNALSSAMMERLEQAIARAAADDGVRVVVIAARGPVFSSGHDLRELRRLAAAAEGDGTAGDTSREAQLELCLPVFELCSRMMEAIVRCEKPVIAAVQGLATAAGCQLVASCDLAVAARSAAFATPGVDIGLFCSTPAVAVARAVGRRAAMEMLLTGERIGADRARELGLVNRVVPDDQLEVHTQQLAVHIASRSRTTIALGKRAFYQQLEQGLGEAYRTASRAMACNLLEADAQEGIDAFFEKRPPRWNQS